MFFSSAWFLNWMIRVRLKDAYFSRIDILRKNKYKNRNPCQSLDNKTVVLLSFWAFGKYKVGFCSSKTEQVIIDFGNEDLHTVFWNEDLHTVFRNEDLHTVFRNEDLHTVFRNEDLHTVFRNEDLHSYIHLTHFQWKYAKIELGTYLTHIFECFVNFSAQSSSVLIWHVFDRVLIWHVS